eukprot:TRINITY_DN6059_c0_g2_i2.p1 TRINITY_DN6059_c0_g2~~TRINITY_DN6059_c0_g2_i2.p1  ORF type:complete len:205 (-),score=7.39 TRINITY_DN6059_c0_g2_i2:46-660(-)
MLLIDCGILQLQYGKVGRKLPLLLQYVFILTRISFISYCTRAIMLKLSLLLSILVQLQAYRIDQANQDIQKIRMENVPVRGYQRNLLQSTQGLRLITPGCDPTLGQDCSAEQEPIEVPDLVVVRQCLDKLPDGAIFDCVGYAEQDLCDHLQEGYCEVSCGKCCEDVPLPGTLNCSSFEGNVDLCSHPSIVEQGYCQRQNSSRRR